MRTEITVREYARLTTQEVSDPSLDRAQIPASAFDWLCNLGATFRRSGASLLQIEGRRWLKLDNYVGVIETPCGTRLEILPKHVNSGDSVTSSRRLLKRMIATAIDLPVRVAEETSLERFEAPLSEWVIERFLSALDQLVKRGLRSEYVRVESSQRFLRGQLDIGRQLRRPPGRQHTFAINYDVFVPDRPENRLLRYALDLVCRRTQLPENWRLGHELKALLHEVPLSRNIDADFKRWRNDRLTAHYQHVRPWCELILYRQMPFSLVDQWRGISMLFPMEKLFERFVVAALRPALCGNAQIITQALNKSLCFHENKPMFRLQPDILIVQDGQRWVLDTKWKRLDQADRRSNYQISQSDFYQMFAYGRKYLDGSGTMALVYPKHATFELPLPLFSFDDQLSLWALPFDLDAALLCHDGVADLAFLPTAGAEPYESPAPAEASPAT